MPRPVDFDPFAEDEAAEEPAVDERGFGQRVADAFTGGNRTEFPEAPEFREAYGASLPASAIPAMQAQSIGREGEGQAPEDIQAAKDWRAGQRAITMSAVTPDPQAQLDILKKAIPDLESKTDKFGNVMIKTPRMTDFAYLNKPGASSRDLQEFGVSTAATAPVLGLAGGIPLVGKLATPGVWGMAGRGLAGGTAASVAQDVVAGTQGSEQGIDPGRAAISGAIGAGVPLAIGAAGAVVGGVGAVTNAARDFTRSALNPAAQARREVQGAFATDARTGGLNPISRADRSSAQARGQDLRTMDFGGETVAALARKSANVSPAARSELMRVIGNRGNKMQVGRRGENLIENEFGLSRSSELVRETLQQQARTARQPLYNQAYQQGAAGIDSPILQQLQGSPIFGRAMRRAEGMLRDQAATPGWRTTGMIGHNSGHYTLEFWDMVKRALDDYGGQAMRTGQTQRAALIQQMARDLRNELDAHVPLYRQARGTAATFFGEDDALTAGQAFARGGRYNLDEAQRAFQALNPAERNLFREGFADNLVQRIRQNPNYLNQIRDIPAEFDRVQLALGGQHFDQLEGFLRLEQIMQRMTHAMGNSTTARQLNEMGQSFGGNFWNFMGGGTAGVGVASFSPTAIIAGALIAGGKRAHDQVNRNVAEEVARLLTSTDPDVFLQGINQLGQNRILQAIRTFDHMLTDAGVPRAIAVQTGVNTNSYEPQPAEGR